MWSRREWRVFVAGLVLLVVASNVANAQFRSVLFDVRRLPQLGGTTSYEIIASENGSVFFGVPFGGTSLTSPTGIDFSTNHSQTYNNFADLSAGLFGDWQVVEHPTSGPDNTYTVHVNSFADAAFSPVITSPVDGSTVSTDFVVKWNPNTNTSSRGLAYQPTGLQVASPVFGVDGTFSAELVTQLLQPPPASLTVRSNVQMFPTVPSITQRSASLSGKTITASLAFDSNSLPVTYHVVPEPATIALLVTAFAFVSGGHRGRRTG